MGRPSEIQFIGRQVELETARDVLRRAGDGEPGVLIVGGEAGVGRSRFVDAIAGEAIRDGFRVGAGSCVRMDAGAMPYAAIIAALRDLIRDDDPGSVAASLSGSRREVARLLPEVAKLGTAVPRAPGPPGSSRPSAAEPVGGIGGGGSAAGLASLDTRAGGDASLFERLRLFEAVVEWVAALAAEAAVLLVIDDLQWADASTLDLLRALAVGLPTRAALVLTVRTDQPAAATVRTTIAELDRDGARRVELVPFDRADLMRLVAAATGASAASLDEASVDALANRSGGNPFLALALVDAGAVSTPEPYGGVPASLRDILDAELAALDDGALDVLRAAALDPGPIDDQVLASVLDRPIGTVGGAIRQALEAGVLDAGPRGGGSPAGGTGAPRFRHAIQRDVLIERLGPGERRMLHGRYADALEAGDPDPSRASAIAQHRDAAGDDARSLPAHVAAMAAAERAFAFDAAAAHGARAATLRVRLSRDGDGEAAALLERSSLDALLAGDAPGSAELARRALVLVGDHGELAAALHDRLRWALWESGDHAGAARELGLAVDRLGDEPPGSLRALLTAQQAAMHMDEPDPAPALDLADAAAGMARTAGSAEVEALALGVRGRTLAMHGRVDDGIESLRAAVAIADAVGSLHGQVVGHAMIVAVLARCGRSRAALEEADAALAIADASGIGRSLGASLTADAASACFAFGAWDDADRRIADGLARRPAALAEAWLRIVDLRLAAARGLEAATPALLERLGALEPVLATAGDVASLDVARAELALARDAPAEVRSLGDRALEAVAGGAGRTSSLAWLGVLALQAEIDLCLDARGRGDEAAAKVAERRIAAIGAVGEREATEALVPWGDRATALVAQFEAERGRIDLAPAGRAAAWERAIAAWEAIERPYFAAYARYRLAEARLAAGGDREAIAEPLAAPPRRSPRSAPGHCSPAWSASRGWRTSGSAERRTGARITGTPATRSRRSSSRPASGRSCASSRPAGRMPGSRTSSGSA